MHPDDQEKTVFIIEWGMFVVVVMMFGIKTAPAMFQRIISEVFGEYILAFMQVILDNLAVYGKQKDQLHYLRLCLERCRTTIAVELGKSTQSSNPPCRKTRKH